MMFTNPVIIKTFGTGSPTLSFISSVRVLSSSFTYPSGVMAGDLLLFFDFAHNGGGGPPVAVIPAGTSNTNNISVNLDRAMLSYKIAIGTESGTLIGMNGDSSNKKACILFRASVPLSSVLVFSVNNEGTVGDPVQQTLFTAGVAGTAFLLGVANSSNAVTATGTLQSNGNQINLLGLGTPSCYYEVQRGSFSNRTWDAASFGTFNTLQSVIFQVA